MYNFRVISYEGDQETSYNFQAKSYRHKKSPKRNELEIFGIQDTISEDQCSTMTIDFLKENDSPSRIYVMNENGKTIDRVFREGGQKEFDRQHKPMAGLPEEVYYKNIRFQPEGLMDGRITTSGFTND